MAKRYIIEEIRATHWSARVRDAESGEVSEVPLEGGGRWPGKLRADLVNHEAADAGTPSGEDAAPPPESAERAPIGAATAGQFNFMAYWQYGWEDFGVAEVFVTRSQGAVGGASVQFTTANHVPQSAQAGLDYTTVTTTLNFADGETTKSVLVPILADAASEGVGEGLAVDGVVEDVGQHLQRRVVDGETHIGHAAGQEAGLATAGQRVLLVDLDPQGNATMGSGIDKRELGKSVYHLLVGLGTVAEARVRSEAGKYDVIPANRDLAGAEVELVGLERRENRLRDALALHAGEYDFILIDCPPSLSLLTLNGLCVAHGVIIPMQCEYYALEGLSDLVNSIKKVHANLNRDLGIIGLLRVMFDPRVTLQQQVSAQLEAHFGDKVFTTIVPRNVRLAEAPSHGLPGVVFDRSAKGAQAYLAFAKEMIERVKTL